MPRMWLTWKTLWGSRRGSDHDIHGRLRLPLQFDLDRRQAPLLAPFHKPENTLSEQSNHLPTRLEQQEQNGQVHHDQDDEAVHDKLLPCSGRTDGHLPAAKGLRRPQGTEIPPGARLHLSAARAAILSGRTYERFVVSLWLRANILHRLQTGHETGRTRGTELGRLALGVVGAYFRGVC